MQSSPVSTWWQSPACYDWLCHATDLIPLGVVVLRDDRPVGLVLGYVTHSRHTLLQHFSARAIINGGPLLAADITQDELTLLLSKVLSWSSDSPVYMETRNFRDYTPWRDTFEQAGWSYCPHYDVWADTDKQWRERLHESKTRKVRSMMPDCTVCPLDYAPQQEDNFDAWYGILTELYQRKVRRPVLSRATLLEGWKSGMTLLLVKQNDKLIGGVLLPHDDQWAYEYYICGPTIVTYAMLEWCEQQGILHLDMMGAGEPDVPYGVRDFKLQMGGTLLEFGRYLYVCSPVRYALGKLALRLRY